MYYLQSRYYNADWGRFVNGDDTDILQLEQGQLLEANLFAYCANNPINMIDEDGFQFKAIFTKLPSLIKGVKIAGKYVYKYAAKGVSFVKNACGKIFKKGWAKSVPNKAYDIANKIKSKNGAPPKGYKRLEVHLKIYL